VTSSRGDRADFAFQALVDRLDNPPPDRWWDFSVFQATTDIKRLGSARFLAGAIPFQYASRGVRARAVAGRHSFRALVKFEAIPQVG